MHQLCCLHPACPAVPRTSCPWNGEVLQHVVLEHSFLQAPMQSLAGISPAVWLKHSNKSHGKPISNDLPEPPLPTKLLGSQFVLFIEKDRRISKRLGRFPRFITAVLGHSYTEGCSPSCLWEVPIALGWVIYTPYHKRVNGKALHSGGWISEDHHTILCSLWVTALNHGVEKAKLKGRFTSPLTQCPGVAALHSMQRGRIVQSSATELAISNESFQIVEAKMYLLLLLGLFCTWLSEKKWMKEKRNSQSAFENPVGKFNHSAIQLGQIL